LVTSEARLERPIEGADPRPAKPACKVVFGELRLDERAGKQRRRLARVEKRTLADLSA